jgi:hypothetical protein
MDRLLLPPTRLRLRIVLFVILIIPALIGSTLWSTKLCAVAMVAFLVGTYRQSLISGAEFHTNMAILFVPLSTKTMKLKFVATIETSLERRAGLWTFFLFGPTFMVFSWIADFLLPWIGGAYGLTLVSGKGKRVHAWQGNNEDDFQKNLAMLKNATGAEVVRA